MEMGASIHSESSPPPDVDAQFWGPGNHLYRNYHTGLDGILLCYQLFAGILTISFIVFSTPL